MNRDRKLLNDQKQGSRKPKTVLENDPILFY